MMKTTRRVAFALAAAVAFGALAFAAQELALEVVSPTADAFVSGSTWLRAAVQPPGRTTSIVFFVDGRLVCTVTAPPYECEWDAGPKVIEHQVRVVANLAGGGRVVRTVRTKSLGFTEVVDVEVVQVTVTVADGHGHFIRGLPRASFKVFEDNRQQTISHFASENIPLELIVAIDISGSMSPAMPKLKSAVKEFLGAVPPRTR